MTSLLRGILSVMVGALLMAFPALVLGWGDLSAHQPVVESDRPISLSPSDPKPDAHPIASPLTTAPSSVASKSVSPRDTGVVDAGGSGGRQTLPESWERYNIDENSLGAAVKGQWPFSPEQTSQIFEMFRQMNAATQVKVPAPHLRRRMIDVSLDPAAEVPAIAIAANYPSALTFKDITGAPFPVKRVLGDRPFFGGASGEGKGATVYIAPVPNEQGHIQPGSIMIELEGIDSPLTFNLREDQTGKDGLRQIDSTVEIKVPRAGPDALAADLMDVEAFLATDPTVAGFLGGYIPNGAAELVVEPKLAGLRAWRLGHHVYLKTQGRIVLPAPIAGERSPGGVSVYKLPDTPRVMVSQSGKNLSLTLRERSYATNE